MIKVASQVGREKLGAITTDVRTPKCLSLPTHGSVVNFPRWQNQQYPSLP